MIRERQDHPCGRMGRCARQERTQAEREQEERNLRQLQIQEMSNGAYESADDIGDNGGGRNDHERTPMGSPVLEKTPLNTPPNNGAGAQ
jgi:hypothetical protein